MGLWELVSLEFDKHAKEIGKYFENVFEMPIRRVKYHRKGRHYFSKRGICNKVNEALGEGLERKLVVYGSGSYHQFTYGLCRHADRISTDYAYIHFDHHDDSHVRNNRNSVSCGAFVVDILEDTNASAALYIGSFPSKRLTKKPQLGIFERDIKKGRYLKKLRWRLSKLPEEVYLSFDLDVMPESVICTDYNQGSLGTKKLMKCISIIKQSKHIIGADVLGYAGVKEDPGKEIYARIVDSLLEA